ncbi:1-phosphatidylinositol-4-phosphate 5-kinase-like protein, partial [Trifolium pratense]
MSLLFCDTGGRERKYASLVVVVEVRVYSNGNVYEGEMKGGKCCGSGVYYYNISGRYESDWVDGKYDGFGVETWSKGSMYRDGFRNGFGVYRFYTADVYAGQWFNGQK